MSVPENPKGLDWSQLVGAMKIRESWAPGPAGFGVLRIWTGGAYGTARGERLQELTAETLRAC